MCEVCDGLMIQGLLMHPSTQQAGVCLPSVPKVDLPLKYIVALKLSISRNEYYNIIKYDS